MIRYRSDLSDRIQRMESNIKSNHNGINYDIKTIVNPRSHAVAVQPAIGLVQKSISAFEWLILIDYDFLWPIRISNFQIKAKEYI